MPHYLHITKKVVYIILFSVVFFACGNKCLAADRNIVAIVKNKDLSYYNEMIDGFKAAVAARKIAITCNEFVIGDGDINEKIKAAAPRMIYALGSTTLKKIEQTVNNVAVVYSAAFAEGDDVLHGDNVTGANFYVSVTDQCEKLKQIIPGIKTVGVIYNPDANEKTIAMAGRKLSASGITLALFPARTPADIPHLENMSVDALWLFPDPVVAQQTIVTRILYTALIKKIPVIGISPSYVKAGAFMALTCDYRDVGKQAGEAAARILQGEKASEIAVTTPRQFKLYLNRSVADKLQVSIPHYLISEASEVYGE